MEVKIMDKTKIKKTTNTSIEYSEMLTGISVIWKKQLDPYVNVKFTKGPRKGQIKGRKLDPERINKFIEKISLLSIDRVNAINQNIVNSKLYIYSNDEIKHDNKEIIKDSLIKKGFIFNNIEYIIKTDLILGIELKVGNNLISWTIKDINENFESVINKILDKDSV